METGAYFFLNYTLDFSKTTPIILLTFETPKSLGNYLRTVSY